MNEVLETQPNPSEALDGSLPHAADALGGSSPKTAEGVGSSPHPSATPKEYRVTVQEATRLLEEAGIPRTERTILSWCRRDAAGRSKLDAVYSTEERRHLINPESLSRLLADERLRRDRSPLGQLPPQVSEEPAEDFGNPRRSLSEGVGREQRGFGTTSEAGGNHVAELEQKVLDLTIMNKGKDYFIDQMKEERSAFIDQLQERSRHIGELETRLLALQAPRESISIDDETSRHAVQ